MTVMKVTAMAIATATAMAKPPENVLNSNQLASIAIIIATAMVMVTVIATAMVTANDGNQW